MVGTQTQTTNRRAISESVGILLVSLAGGVFVGLVVTQLYKPIFSESGEFFVNTVASYVGMGVVAVGYTLIKHDHTFFDFTSISRTDVYYTVTGSVILTGVTVLYSAFTTFTGITPPSDGVTQTLDISPAIIPVFLGVVFLFNAPVEELVFRNLIQKTLGKSFTVWQAITITSLVFAAIHIPNYASSIETLTFTTIFPITVIFSTSIVFGYYYAKSKNIFVPILIHAYYNSLQFMLVIGDSIY